LGLSIKQEDKFSSAPTLGYIEQFDTSEEFKWMSRAGMSFQGILASLTTNPPSASATQLTADASRKDYDADLVVLGADPAQNTSAFSQVRYTIRGGEVIYIEK